MPLPFTSVPEVWSSLLSSRQKPKSFVRVNPYIKYMNWYDERVVKYALVSLAKLPKHTK